MTPMFNLDAGTGVDIFDDRHREIDLLAIASKSKSPTNQNK